MPTVKSRIFKSGNSEAVRLPKDVAFGEEIDVTIVRAGDVLTIYPTRPSVATMIAELEALPGPDDIEVRDVDIIPERPGL
jgi:antitoxin VapB